MTLKGLGCDASTMVGTDCDTFWYYTWPPCWSNSRDQWSQICQALPPATGGGNTTCTLGVCSPNTPTDYGPWIIGGVALLGLFFFMGRK